MKNNKLRLGLEIYAKDVIPGPKFSRLPKFWEKNTKNNKKLTKTFQILSFKFMQKNQEQSAEWLLRIMQHRWMHEK